MSSITVFLQMVLCQLIFITVETFLLTFSLDSSSNFFFFSWIKDWPHLLVWCLSGKRSMPVIQWGQFLFVSPGNVFFTPAQTYPYCFTTVSQKFFFWLTFIFHRTIIILYITFYHFQNNSMIILYSIQYSIFLNFKISIKKTK